VETAISEYPKIKSSQSPIMIEENYVIEDRFDSPKSEELFESSNPGIPKSKDKLHIFVLVHGLGGNASDLLPFKNYISLVNPNSEFIISTKNSADNSDKDINELAENLAKEIDADIEFFDPKKIDKISFIGFSLGGIIIRAALPLISTYKEKFYGFVSLASPHLGLKIKEKYIAAGLWFMKVFSNKK
jgi:predicted esterase